MKIMKETSPLNEAGQREHSLIAEREHTPATEQQMNIELGEMKSKGKRLRSRLRVYQSALSFQGGLQSSSPQCTPSPDDLEAEYKRICLQLNSKYKDRHVTTEEMNLLSLIKKETRLQFEKSVWIGNINVDLFCPAIGGKRGARRMRGLVIEVDGSVHNSQVKMNKDQHKGELLHGLGIGVLTFENEHLYDFQWRVPIRHLAASPRLDSRARSRLWQQIHLVTVLCHLESNEIESLFGMSLDSPLKKSTGRGP